MKKAISILFVLCILVCSLAGCNKEEETVEPIDISGAVQHSTQEGRMILTGFDGDHKNIKVPDSVNGTAIDMLSPSFANGKAVESVELPQRINAFIRQDDGLSLCTSAIPNSVALNNGNAAAVYCEFFHVDSITVNGVAHSKPTSNPNDPDLSGEWKNIDMIGGVRHIQVYTFDGGKVTCTADSEVFEGTYEIKDGKLLMSLGDVTAEFEFVGDQLICWEYNITLSTKDAEDYAVTSETGWSYVVTQNGNAQLTAYHGNDEIVSFPMTVDGYEVSSIHSCIADTYNFTNISFKGYGGIGFARTFEWLYYDELTGAYILYNDASDNDYLGDIRLANMEDEESPGIVDGNYIASSGGRNSSFTAAAYCRFFKQSRMIIDGVEYASPTTTTVTEDGLIGLWKHEADQYYKEMVISIYQDGVAELHYMGGKYDEECTECLLGSYQIADNEVRITFENGTLTLDFIEKKGICWRGNAWTSSEYPTELALDFHKVKREGQDHLIDPFLHISQQILLDTYTIEKRVVGEERDNYIKFEKDGNAVATFSYLGWKDKPVQYTCDADTIVVTDGVATKQFTMEDYWLLDDVGRYYYPSWIED